MPSEPSQSCAGSPQDRMPPLLAQYEADRGCLERRYATPYSPQRRTRLRAFHAEWREALGALPPAGLSRPDQVDCILFRNLLDTEDRLLAEEEQLLAEMEPLLPFLPQLIELDVARRDLQDADPERAAGVLHAALAQMHQTRDTLSGAPPVATVRSSVACRAARALARVRKALDEWHTFYAGYDPLFTWWVEAPYRALEAAGGEYEAFLRNDVAGAEDPDAIIGDPVGRDGLTAQLRQAMIPYSPDDLMEIGRREQAWCMAELKRAAREMGLGDDWRAAIEEAKGTHVPPGRQPAMVRDLAAEAVAYVREHDLVTVPPLAEECWRMEMMPPEKQKVNPFFLGGEAIIVSYPTNSMDHEQKRMSLRGNNPAFSRATVQHELIPGHHLQGFSQARHRPYRRLFYTPFWTEGWTLSWELLLWDLGFPRTPLERIGMLFWRLHRCVRVVFSLGFHLGQLTAAECVDMLVDEVGHERQNALGEVRRSFGGDYDALYQCAYLIGGLQMHALRAEVTSSGPMSLREFHDAVMHENCMPIGVLRALLTDRPLDEDECANWRFDRQATDGSAR